MALIEIQQPEGVVARLVLLHYKKGEWNMHRYAWENPSLDEAEWKIGDLVWPAGEDKKARFVVKEIHQPGEKFYPEGGVVCTCDGANRVFYLDSIIKHIEEPKKKKAKK